MDFCRRWRQGVLQPAGRFQGHNIHDLYATVADLLGNPIHFSIVDAGDADSIDLDGYMKCDSAANANQLTEK